MNLTYKISEKIKKDPSDLTGYEDLLHVGLSLLSSDPPAVAPLRTLQTLCEEGMRHIPLDSVHRLYDIHRQAALAAAPYDFESYLVYVEWGRAPERKFYIPRRAALKPCVQAMQRLADREIDLLAISLPPGTGKSTLAIFFLTWLAGKYPDKPILTGSHSNNFIRGAYDECLRIIDPNGEYLWHDVFPHVNLVGTNAKDCRIDLGKSKRFETLEFTSVGTGNAGLYRAATLLYCDDLVSGLEVALSKDRLDKLWGVYTTDLRQRKIGDVCGELHIATRWSVHDVIGRLERMYEGSSRAEFISVPALNANDESNFDYPYGVGFSTATYHEQRDIMDDVNWRALYMNQPIEREGLLYHPDELRRFFELPSSPPDAIIGVCDTKDTGKDYCVLPVACVYGSDYYIPDVVCSNALPEVVDGLLIDVLLRNRVQQCRFESNAAGGRVAKDVQAGVRSRGGVTHITTKYTTANKETKIIVNSSWVKEHCLFLDPSQYRRQSDYGRFMDMLCSYTVAGRNRHDDVPDAMAQLALFAQSLSGARVEIMDRPW